MEYRIYDKKDNRYVKVLSDIANLERENFLTDGETVYVIHKDLQLFKDCNQDKFIVERYATHGIYENDIVGIQMKSPNEMYKAIVKFDECSFYFDAIDEDMWIEDWNFVDDINRFEILGTIHDKENK